MSDAAYRAHIKSLEDELERLTQRVKAAESALREVGQADWNRCVAPLSLRKTRILRLLAERDMTSTALLKALSAEYPTLTAEMLRVYLSHLRSALPEAIAPTRLTTWFEPYSVPDREQLRAFLSGEPIEQRRAA